MNEPVDGTDASLDRGSATVLAVAGALPAREDLTDELACVAAASARRLYARLMSAGARIYEWRGMMVHAKTAVADGEIALVGSSNLDPLSMTRNYELNLLLADPATGARMQEMFEHDLCGAREIRPEQWARRPWWQKAAESAAGFFDGNL